MTTTMILISCRNKEAARNNYLTALHLAGWTGETFLLAPGDTHPDLRAVSGLLLAGGLDIHPRHWDPAEPVHPASEPDEERDALEIPLVRLACERRLPVLGVCRGAQVLNVALGGSLIQHVPEFYGCPEDRHRHGSSTQPEVHHTVTLDPASRLAAILGTTQVPVNSRHHQALDRLAPQLVAAGWHLDTTHPGQGPLVEAVESRDPAHWLAGVQWHPENLVRLEGEPGFIALRLFRAFLAEAARRA